MFMLKQADDVFRENPSVLSMISPCIAMNKIIGSTQEFVYVSRSEAYVGMHVQT